MFGDFQINQTTESACESVHLVDCLQLQSSVLKNLSLLIVGLFCFVNGRERLVIVQRWGIVPNCGRMTQEGVVKPRVSPIDR